MRLNISVIICSLFALISMIGGQAFAIGILLPKGDGAKPLALKYHRVSVKIKDGAATTAVKQSFQNNTNRVLEGTFYFPLPDGATISDFALYMNGKRVTGEVLEKQKARRIYEAIVRRMRDPGLIEYLNRKLFRARIYPILAKGEMKVDISFAQILPFNDGIYRYEYPMRTPHQNVRTLKDFTLATTIESQVPIKTVFSPSHKVFVKKKNDNHAMASFEQSRLKFDKDFVLYYSVSKKSIGLNLLTYRPKGEAGYYLLMASPKSKLRDAEIVGKGLTFVIDTSGSMSGEKIKHAKAALAYCLKKLNSKDWFNIIRFSSDVEKFEKWQVPANADNVKRALKFVSQLEAGGATAFSEALNTALKVKGARQQLVMFITDGRPTIGETQPKEIAKQASKANQNKANVFFFGVGEDLNIHLMDRIAKTNRGFSTYVKPNQEIEHKIATFYNKISYPVMSDISLDFASLKHYAMVPRKPSDLFKGSQLIILGRYRNSGHFSVTLSGKVGTTAKKFVYEGIFPKSSTSNEFIAKLWAHRQIGYLLDQIRLRGQSRELKAEIIQLAKKFGIVTPYTSYLVTEPKKRPIRRVFRMPRQRWNRGGLRGSGIRMPARKPRPAPTVLNNLSDLKKDSGKTGVRVARKLRKMKEQQHVGPSDDRISTRYVAGRRFALRSGIWLDSRYKGGPKLQIKYLSTAYFSLLKVAPSLSGALRLGSRVVVVYRGKAIEVGPSGESNLSVQQIKAKLQ